MRWQNSIVAEERIHIGSTNTIRPDFVLYKDEIPQVVIEAKKPNNIQTERNKEQLFSYMRQKKVDFGLYIGEEIQLYYDVPTDVELPLLIFTLDYNEEKAKKHFEQVKPMMAAFEDLSVLSAVARTALNQLVQSAICRQGSSAPLGTVPPTMPP